jgi:hypothetical protein
MGIIDKTDQAYRFEQTFETKFDAPSSILISQTVIRQSAIYENHGVKMAIGENMVRLDVLVWHIIYYTVPTRYRVKI